MVQTWDFLLRLYAAGLAALSACGSASAQASAEATAELAGASPPVARMASSTSLSAIGAGWLAADAAVCSGFVSLSVRPVRYQLPLWRLNS